ncbi:hypothetical protein GCM10009677_61580 [Sphaerisporangium rubeum]
MGVDDGEGREHLGAEDLHEPGGHHEIGLVRRDGVAQRHIPGRSVRMVGDLGHERRQPGPAGPGQPFDAVTVRADRDDLGAECVIGGGVDEGL